MKPQNFEEGLVWYTLLGTYGLYFIGAQAVVIPILAAVLTLCLCKKLWYQTERTPAAERITIPTSIWIWVIAVLIMEFGIIMAHVDWDLGLRSMISSFLGWTRSWAPMAFLPLAGCLNIRPQLIYRGACIFCLQNLVFILIAYALYVLHIPSPEYVTPWSILGGDKVTWSVNLYEYDIYTHELRLLLFTPFANTLGVVGSVYFCLVRQEADKRLRWLGMIAAAAMVISSLSRMTTLTIFMVPVLTWLLTNFSWSVQIAAGITFCLTGLFAPPLFDFLEDLWDQTIKSYRAGSELVRARLFRLALEGSKEAPIWGHGVVAAQGPKYTELVPIGTHHQWAGILYIQGIVGFMSFLIPMVWTTLDLLVKAQKSVTAKVALSIFLTLWICTYGADIQAASCYYWPGLLLTGIALKQKAPIPIAVDRKYALS